MSRDNTFPLVRRDRKRSLRSSPVPLPSSPFRSLSSSDVSLPSSSTCLTHANTPDGHAEDDARPRIDAEASDDTSGTEEHEVERLERQRVRAGERETGAGYDGMDERDDSAESGPVGHPMLEERVHEGADSDSNSGIISSAPSESGRPLRPIVLSLANDPTQSESIPNSASTESYPIFSPVPILPPSDRLASITPHEEEEEHGERLDDPSGGMQLGEDEGEGGAMTRAEPGRAGGQIRVDPVEMMIGGDEERGGSAYPQVLESYPGSQVGLEATVATSEKTTRKRRPTQDPPAFDQAGDPLPPRKKKRGKGRPPSASTNFPPTPLHLPDGTILHGSPDESERPDLALFTIQELQGSLASKGLMITGKKSVLIDRVLEEYRNMRAAWNISGRNRASCGEGRGSDIDGLDVVRSKEGISTVTDLADDASQPAMPTIQRSVRRGYNKTIPLDQLPPKPKRVYPRRVKAPPPTPRPRSPPAPSTTPSLAGVEHIEQVEPGLGSDTNEVENEEGNEESDDESVAPADDFQREAEELVARLRDLKENGPSVLKPFPEDYVVPIMCVQAASGGKVSDREDEEDAGEEGLDREDAAYRAWAIEEGTTGAHGPLRAGKGWSSMTPDHAKRILETFLPARKVTVPEDAADSSGPRTGIDLNPGETGSALVGTTPRKLPNSSPPPGKRFFCLSCDRQTALVAFPNGRAGCQTCGTVDPDTQADPLTASVFIPDPGVIEMTDALNDAVKCAVPRWGRDTAGNGTVKVKLIKNKRGEHRTHLAEFISRICNQRLTAHPLLPPITYLPRLARDSSQLLFRVIEKNANINPVIPLGKRQRSGKILLETGQSMADACAEGGGGATTIGRVWAVACIVVTAKQMEGMEWLTMVEAVRKGWIDAGKKISYHALRLAHEINLVPPTRPLPLGPLGTMPLFSKILLEARTSVKDTPQKDWHEFLRAGASAASREELVTPIVNHLQALTEDFPRNRLRRSRPFYKTGSASGQQAGGTTNASDPQDAAPWTAKLIHRVRHIHPEISSLAVRIMKAFEDTRERGKDRRSIACACVVAAMEVLAGEGLIKAVELINEFSEVLLCTPRTSLVFKVELMTMVNDWAQFVPALGMRWTLPVSSVPFWYQEHGKIAVARSHMFVLMLPNVLENAVELCALATNPETSGLRRSADLYRELYKAARPLGKGQSLFAKNSPALAALWYERTDRPRPPWRYGASDLQAAESRDPIARELRRWLPAPASPRGPDHDAALSIDVESPGEHSSLSVAPDPLPPKPKRRKSIKRVAAVGIRVAHPRGWSSQFKDLRNVDGRRPTRISKPQEQAIARVLKAERHVDTVQKAQALSEGKWNDNPYDTMTKAIRSRHMGSCSPAVVRVLLQWQSERVFLGPDGVVFKSESAREDYQQVKQETDDDSQRNGRPVFSLRRWLLEGKAPRDIPPHLVPHSITTARSELDPSFFSQADITSWDDEQFNRGEFDDVLFLDGEIESYVADHDVHQARHRILEEEGVLETWDEMAQLAELRDMMRTQRKEGAVKTMSVEGIDVGSDGEVVDDLRVIGEEDEKETSSEGDEEDPGEATEYESE